MIRIVSHLNIKREELTLVAGLLQALTSTRVLFFAGLFSTICISMQLVSLIDSSLAGGISLDMGILLYSSYLTLIAVII